MSYRVLPVLLVSLLAGCAVREANLKMHENQRAATDSERKAILAHMRDNLFDPYSIKDAEISQALPGMGLDGKYSYMICVKMNAKNRMGAYAGRSATMYYFNENSQLFNVNDDTSVRYACGSDAVKYNSFPEVESIGQSSSGSKRT